MIIVGHGARLPHDAVLALAERLDAPVITTFKAKGIVPDDHPLGCGVLGRSGTPVGELADERVRLLLRARRVVLEPHRHRHQYPIDPGRLRPDDARPVPPGDVPVWGDIGVTVARAARPAPPDVDRADQRADVAAALGDLARREGAPAPLDDRGPACIRRSVFDGARPRSMPDDAVIAVDVGNHAYSFGRYFECKPPGRADVGLPRLDRLRLPGRDGRLGARAGADPQGRRGHRRRRLRPVPRRAHHRGEVRHDRSPTCCSTTASSARSAKEQRGAIRPRLADRPRQPRLRRVRRAVRRAGLLGAARPTSWARRWGGAGRTPTGRRWSRSTLRQRTCDGHGLRRTAAGRPAPGGGGDGHR